MTRGAGYTDAPLVERGQDQLDLAAYADGLTDFILRTQTPMTIGIQGEWGSGKTSLMRLVKAELLARAQGASAGVEVHWFETWQYGAIGQEDHLGAALLQGLCSTLVAKLEGDSTAYTVVRRLDGALKSMARGVLGKAIDAGSGNLISGGQVVDQLFPQTATPAANDIRDSFGKLVERALQLHDGRGRFVVFIDDLDRVRPGRAVRLLEVLKNFMDVERCVFVVACDYDVVREGVREVLGIQEKAKVDAFFHKLFQVPFHMPTGSYNLKNLLSEFIRERVEERSATTRSKTQLKSFAETTARRLSRVVEAALGCNPRAFKRFMNVVDLTCCIDDSARSSPRTGEQPNPLGFWDLSDEQHVRRWLFSLMGIVALQQRWPELASVLLQQAGETGGNVFGYTNFERRLRTVTGEWPDELSDDDHLRPQAPDESVNSALRAHYGWDLDSIDAPAEELRAFCQQWFECLNNGHDKERLTAEELHFIVRWAKRLDEMGRSAIKLTGWHAFRAETHKRSANAGDAYAGVALELERHVRSDLVEQLTSSANPENMSFSVGRAGARCDVLRMSVKSHFQVTVAGSERLERTAHLPGLAAAADRLSLRLQALTPPIGTQPVQRGFKFRFERGHRPGRVKPLVAALIAFLDDVDVIAAAPVRPGQPEAAGGEAPVRGDGAGAAASGA